MEKEIPVIIVHFGNKPKYLKVALKSAADYNKTVVLLGDTANEDFWENHWNVDLAKLDKFQEFLKYYVYMSDVPKEIDIAYFKRLFAMEEWMKQGGHDKAFHLDSDLMTFANYSTEMYPLLPQDCTASLMAVEKELHDYIWVISCHFSYWTLAALEDFNNFCIDAYRNKTIREKLEEKWKWHVDNNKGGGITDMSLLYFWAKDNPKVVNFTKVWNNTTADHNFNQPDQYYEKEYEMHFRLKKFIFKDGVPYGYNTRLNKWVRFLCVHCQGTGKCTMTFLGHKQLRHLYVIPRILLRIKSKYFRFSCRKLKKKMSSKDGVK